MVTSSISSDPIYLIIPSSHIFDFFIVICILLFYRLIISKFFFGHLKISTELINDLFFRLIAGGFGFYFFFCLSINAIETFCLYINAIEATPNGVSPFFVMNIELKDSVMNDFHKVFTPVIWISLLTITLGVFQNISDTEAGSMTTIKDKLSC